MGPEIFWSPAFVIVGVLAVGGWIYTTRLRIKHGYPLEDSWGRKVEPKVGLEVNERLRLLDTENAKLRAEVASLKDRTAVLERIVTDGAQRLDREIDALRTGPVN